LDAAATERRRFAREQPPIPLARTCRSWYWQPTSYAAASGPQIGAMMVRIPWLQRECSKRDLDSGANHWSERSRATDLRLSDGIQHYCSLVVNLTAVPNKPSCAPRSAPSSLLKMMVIRPPRGGVSLACRADQEALRSDWWRAPPVRQASFQKNDSRSISAWGR
jgi:hypothetical protein